MTMENNSTQAAATTISSISSISTNSKTPTIREQHVKKKNVKARLFFFGALLLALLVMASFAESFCPYDPYAQNLDIALQAPSAEHIFGTDRYGRDMLSRVIAASHVSIFSSLSLVAAITIIGTTIGIVCGWRGGRLDTVLMRAADMFLAFPGLVFAMAVAGVMGGGIMSAVIALAAISWPKYARVARSKTLSVREMAYMRAARLSGSGTLKIIVRHILPNILTPIIVTSMLDIGTMMMELAGLSFLGLGAKPPIAEWGSMMSETRRLLSTVPIAVFAPGGAIFVSVMIFNLFGDALRDYMDPKRRGR